MSLAGEVLVGLVIAVGVLGVVVPVLPGELLVAAAVTVWATETGGAVAWWFTAAALAVLATGWVAGWWLGHRHLGRSQVPRRALMLGGVLGAVGFFVVPVLGLLLGFVGGVYAAQRLRGCPHRAAWPATLAALRASGLVLLVHLAGALCAATVWVVAVLVS